MDELFYKTGELEFVYVFKYGVVCFLNYDDAGVDAYLQKIAAYCKNRFELRLSEEFEVETNARENKFGYYNISTFLEWIIKVLVALEVLNLLIDKIFRHL